MLSLQSVGISSEEFLLRRQTLVAQLSENSVCVVFAAQELSRSNDTEYPFRQNSDFYYLTGFNEPDAVLLLSNTALGSVVFVRPSNPLAEVWHGRRLGVDKASSALQVDMAHNVEDIKEILPHLVNTHKHLYFDIGTNARADDIVQDALRVCKKAPKQSMHAPSAICDINGLIHKMRLVKSEAEIKIMQHSADISCQAHCDAMKVCKPGVFEYQLEATILHRFAMQGARFAAYNSIVGGGENACILHYTENKDVLNDGELVLIDAGSEYQGYAADITRTFPVNGKFSVPQAQLYNLVLQAQEVSLAVLKAGTTIAQAMEQAVKVINEGLINLGILRGTLSECIKSEAHKAYFMHGLGHYLGLDVHDVGEYKKEGIDIPLSSGMVMTVEPGLYIPVTANVPEQYKGIGIRIEDNILITEQGNVVLTNKVPKTINDIEALMVGVNTP